MSKVARERESSLVVAAPERGRRCGSDHTLQCHRRERAGQGGGQRLRVDYRSTSTIEASGLFFPVSIPEAGDLIIWDGHVGIVVDPKLVTFIGAQTSTGVAQTSCTNGYWATRSGKRFLRFAHFF